MSYFDASNNGTPVEAGYFTTRDALPDFRPGPGLIMNILQRSDALFSFVTFEPNAEAAVHSHSEEQIVIVLEGEMTFSLDGEERLMRAGDIAVAPAWVSHGAVAGPNGCREVDVFTPPRAALIEAISQQDD
jgi:quercetin dioxygenase-like cupin family protein